MGCIWNYYGCITVFFCKAVLRIVPTSQLLHVLKHKSYAFHLGEKPEFRFSHVVLYVYKYMYACTSKPACHWPLWLVSEGGGRHWRAWSKEINHNVNNFKCWWMPWRRGIDSYNACCRKQMLALEALLEHWCSGVTASVILHLTALSKAACTQPEAQVRCTQSESEERPFLWSCGNYSKMTSQCRVNLIIKIQGTVSMCHRPAGLALFWAWHAWRIQTQIFPWTCSVVWCRDVFNSTWQHARRFAISRSTVSTQLS